MSLHDASPGGEGGTVSDGSMTTDAIDAASGSSCTTHAVPPSHSVDPTQWKAAFLTSPIWTCNAAGTTTINSMLGTVTSTSCSIGLPDVTNNVAQTNGGSPVMVVRLRGLSVTNNHVLQLVGDKPIVILVAGNVVVDSGGMIDASASGATPGPGGSTANLCTSNATGLGAAGSSGWGGGGGGFGTNGGYGGYDPSGRPGAMTGNTGISPLRGGCSGGVGGGNTAMPGAGGGAFELDASGTISIGATGAANLVASGGGAPSTSFGGNGGGAGGAVVLVSPAMAQLGAGGALRANGGAGSSGCSGLCTPNPGTDGHKTDANAATDTSGTPGGGNMNDHGRKGGLADLVGSSPLVSADADMTTVQTGGRGGGGGGGGRLLIAVASATSSCD
jgi:hypothetical protein